MIENKPILTIEDLENVTNKITFKNSELDFDWKFHFKPFKDLFSGKKGWFLWASFNRPDCNTGEMGRGRGRDEIVWEGTMLSSVVKTCWLVIELLIRHELMEGFHWDGYRIFNPHHTVEELASIKHDER